MARTAVTEITETRRRTAVVDEPRVGPQTIDDMVEELRRAEIGLALAEIRHTQTYLDKIFEADAREIVDTERGWHMVSSGGSIVSAKNDWFVPGKVQDPAIMRREAYRAWRTNPHARGIVRGISKFVIGRQFKLDFQDQQRGKWADKEKFKLTITAQNADNADADTDPLAVKLVWDDFAKRNNFLQRGKEIVTRALRDGEVFVRRFIAKDGRVSIRFIEPEYVSTPMGDNATPEPVNVDGELRPVAITDGIEHLENDVESVIAYHVRRSANSQTWDRVPAEEVIHRKVLADSNDLRGIPLLEVVMKKLTQYEQWIDYRIILNKVRAAVALVRKIETGTEQQARAIVQARQPARSAPDGRIPQTASGAREAMLRPGTVLTPGPGVSYEYLAPKLEATDAQHDGRAILLTVSAGLGLPEMLVTGDFSNANFASTTEAMKVAQREWDDWQDFFAPVFERIVEWVIRAAIDANVLKAETDTDVVLGWPTIIQEDAAKQTERFERLHNARVLSRRTWAVKEGLVFDDEMENFAEEDEMDPSLDRAEFDRAGEQMETERDAEKIATTQEALLALNDLQEAFSEDSVPGHLRDAAESYFESARKVVLARA